MIRVFKRGNELIIRHKDVEKYLETQNNMLGLRYCESNTGTKFVPREYSSLDEVIQGCRKISPKATRLFEWKAERIKQLGIYLEKIKKNNSEDLICINN